MSSPAEINVTIRESRPGDAAGVRRLAALDSAPVPHGRLLLAEIDGRLLAAVSVDGGRVIADPFAETAILVAMLRAGRPPAARAHTRRRPRVGARIEVAR